MKQTGHLLNDKLHFRICVWLQNQEQTVSPLYNTIDSMDSDTFSDMVVVSGVREFRVHRCILALQTSFEEDGLREHVRGKQWKMGSRRHGREYNSGIRAIFVYGFVPRFVPPGRGERRPLAFRM